MAPIRVLRVYGSIIVEGITHKYDVFVHTTNGSHTCFRVYACNTVVRMSQYVCGRTHLLVPTGSVSDNVF